MDRVQLLTDSLIESVKTKARTSPRLRANHNFHAGPDDNPHRFLNVLTYGTYVAPHRHKDPPKAESFIVLEGKIAFFIFDDAGNVEQRITLGPGEPARGIDLAPGLWHTLAALSPQAVCYEVKPGPWDPATDKEFAPWAPQEGDALASAYLRKLLGE
ncbi:MAG: WbuC family cupin fold metalloprotein [Bryobacteraceae bacterium]